MSNHSSKAMNKDDLLTALTLLNDKMHYNNIYGDIAIYGGAVMCLTLGSRESTRDIDAIFEPKLPIYQLASQVASDLNIQKDWLNDGVKGFISQNNDVTLFKTFSNLRVFTASPQYMFAMKMLSSRLNSDTEVEDITFLIKYLGIRCVDDAEAIIRMYYPMNRLLPKSYYFLLEVLGC